jgi:hypothetical protein
MMRLKQVHFRGKKTEKKRKVLLLHVRGATQKFPKFECRAKTACSTVVGL